MLYGGAILYKTPGVWFIEWWQNENDESDAESKRSRNSTKAQHFRCSEGATKKSYIGGTIRLGTRFPTVEYDV